MLFRRDNYKERKRRMEFFPPREEGEKNSIQTGHANVKQNLSCKHKISLVPCRGMFAETRQRNGQSKTREFC